LVGGYIYYFNKTNSFTGAVYGLEKPIKIAKCHTSNGKTTKLMGLMPTLLMDLRVTTLKRCGL
jgi:hypothetical protein